MERKEEEGGEKRQTERDNLQGIEPTILSMCPHWESNPPPLWCKGQRFNQLSHTDKG